MACLYFQDIPPSAEKPILTGLLVNFPKPSSPPPSTTDHFLARLALLLTSEKTDDPISSNRQDLIDHIHLITWLVIILTEEKGISAARIDYSPCLFSLTQQSLPLFLATSLPASDIRIVSHALQNDALSPPILLQVTGETAGSSSSVPVLHFGGQHSEGFFAFTPENVLTHTGDSPFLGFLLSDTSESRDYRHAIQQLLRNNRKTRLLRAKIHSVQEDCLEKTHLIQDLRVSLRMLSNKKAVALSDTHSEEKITPHFPAPSIAPPPVPPSCLRGSRRLTRSPPPPH